MRGPRLGTSIAGGCAGGGAAAGHLLYPAWLAWRTRGGAGGSPRPQAGGTRSMARPDRCRAGLPGGGGDRRQGRRPPGQWVPGPLEILVVADGDPETAAAAERAGARALTGPERLGKSQALNRGFEEADTPIVVISDANNRLVPGALAAAVEHFADPDVGAVAGEKLEDDGGGGESLYWKFESWLKQREDRLGTTIGLVGELAAIRAEAWRPIPADVAIDDLWAALDIIEQGYRVAYEPRARATRSRRGVAVGPVGAPDPQCVRSPARCRPAPAPAPAFGRAGGRRALGAPPGPLHRSPLAHLALLVLSVSRCARARSPGRSCWPICARAPDWWPRPGRASPGRAEGPVTPGRRSGRVRRRRAGPLPAGGGPRGPRAVPAG